MPKFWCKLGVFLFSSQSESTWRSGAYARISSCLTTLIILLSRVITNAAEAMLKILMYAVPLSWRIHWPWIFRLSQISIHAAEAMAKILKYALPLLNLTESKNTWRSGAYAKIFIFRKFWSCTSILSSSADVKELAFHPNIVHWNPCSLSLKILIHRNRKFATGKLTISAA